MEAIVLDRIRELLVFRHWYRQNRWATWTDIRKEHETELRALVRVARQARRMGHPLNAHQPFIDHPADATWTEGELVAGWGK